jgi:hypothetical protein
LRRRDPGGRKPSIASIIANDKNQERIQVFDTSGNFIAVWGKDVVQSGAPGDTGTGYEVCTAAADCQAGTIGTLGGELDQQAGGDIAAAADGAVYVADYNNNRVQRFADSPPPGATTTTTVPGATTTTTTLPCTTARCSLDASVASPACAGQVVPSSVTAKLDQAATFIEDAGTRPAKQTGRLLKRARRS